MPRLHIKFIKTMISTPRPLILYSRVEIKYRGARSTFYDQIVIRKLIDFSTFLIDRMVSSSREMFGVSM